MVDRDDEGSRHDARDEARTFRASFFVTLNQAGPEAEMVICEIESAGGR